MSDAAAVRPWWEGYFSKNYATLYKGPLAEELATDVEVETLTRLFAGSKRPIVDLGCGYGRHLAPLTTAKLPMVGVDLSQHLLTTAPKRLRPRMVRGDLRNLALATGSCDGAIMLFNTFGYFDDESNVAVLSEVARILAPGGRLVMDMPARAGMKAVVDEVPAAISHRGRYSIYESWFIAANGDRLTGHGSWQIGKQKQEWELSLRLYSPAEITRLLRKAGFDDAIEVRPAEDFELLGSGEKAPGPSDSTWRTAPNMALLARKAGKAGV